jgi:hypothetical protein
MEVERHIKIPLAEAQPNNASGGSKRFLGPLAALLPFLV